MAITLPESASTDISPYISPVLCGQKLAFLCLCLRFLGSNPVPSVRNPAGGDGHGLQGNIPDVWKGIRTGKMKMPGMSSQKKIP